MGSAWPGVCVVILLEQKPWEDPRVLWTTAALVGGLLLGAVVIGLTDRWRKHRERDQTSATDQLTNFRSLYERGEISREEYERIRSRLSQKIRQELSAPPLPPTNPDKPAAPEAPAAPEHGVN